jgi:UDP-N-acetylglucosamine:LPS N-acetylglucosamine transferase
VSGPRVLAISSGGGHWVQLQRVMPAFEGHEVAFATVHPAYRADVGNQRFYVIPDATRWDRWGVLRLAARIARILLQERPQVVVSTGAAPGCIALVLGRLLGARTIWLDSIANVERLSLAGRMVRPFAGLWLTQWPHLARERGPECAGRVF